MFSTVLFCLFLLTLLQKGAYVCINKHVSIELTGSFGFDIWNAITVATTYALIITILVTLTNIPVL